MNEDIEEFDVILSTLSSQDALNSKILALNKNLGVGFDEYFRLAAFSFLNSDSDEKIQLPLIDYEAFENIKEQERKIPAGAKGIVIEFMKRSGTKYVIGIYLEHDSKFSKLHDMIFLKETFWSVDARHDVTTSTIDETNLPRMLIRYEIKRGSVVEDLYVSVAEV